MSEEVQKRRTPSKVVVIVTALAVIAVAGAVLWWQLSARAESQRALDERAAVLEEANRECGGNGELADGGRTLILEGKGTGDTEGMTFLDQVCTLRELDVPRSVVERIDQTRAMDGRQSADWDDIDASWTYHPSDGLSLLLELKDIE